MRSLHRIACDDDIGTVEEEEEKGGKVEVEGRMGEVGLWETETTARVEGAGEMGRLWGRASSCGRSSPNPATLDDLLASPPRSMSTSTSSDSKSGLGNIAAVDPFLVRCLRGRECEPEPESEEKRRKARRP